tara:strand:+ start:215 stop:343 length:129 start_codon:yes stop_codon:yes gene_type:complete
VVAVVVDNVHLQWTVVLVDPEVVVTVMVVVVLNQVALEIHLL